MVDTSLRTITHFSEFLEEAHNSGARYFKLKITQVDGLGVDFVLEPKGGRYSAARFKANPHYVMGPHRDGKD